MGMEARSSTVAGLLAGPLAVPLCLLAVSVALCSDAPGTGPESDLPYPTADLNIDWDEGPRLLTQPYAFVPDSTYAAALGDAADATVMLVGIIDTTGRFRVLEVNRGSPLLVNAALEAAERYRFSPGVLGGRPTATGLIGIPIRVMPKSQEPYLLEGALAETVSADAPVGRSDAAAGE